MSWHAVQCEPDVLTQVIQEMEVKGVRIEELHSLDSQWLNDLLPIYGLIFLPRYRLPENDDDDRPVLDSDIPNLFFAKQQVNNACPTQAIISILMNSPSHVEIGPQLSNLKEFSRNLDTPLLKSLCITNNKVLRDANNSFAKEEAVESSTSGIDAPTFIIYVPVDNIVYELDGMKEGPISLGRFDGASDGLDWLNVVRPILQQRLAKYMENNIEFTVLSVIKDWKEEYVAGLEILQRRKDQVVQELEGNADNGNLQRILTETDSEIENFKQKISMEDEKIRSWKRENEIRKHSCAQFFLSFLKILSKGKLNDVIEKAMSGEKK